jgi:hypothetical protein
LRSYAPRDRSAVGSTAVPLPARRRFLAPNKVASEPLAVQPSSRRRYTYYGATRAYSVNWPASINDRTRAMN